MAHSLTENVHANQHPQHRSRQRRNRRNTLEHNRFKARPHCLDNQTTGRVFYGYYQKVKYWHDLIVFDNLSISYRLTLDSLL